AREMPPSADVREIPAGSERPMFARFRAHTAREAAGQLGAQSQGVPAAASATPLTTWNGSFTFGGRTFTYNMVGTAPSTGTSTTVPVAIIPIRIVVNNRFGVRTAFDPAHVLSNGSTVTANAVASPIFKAIPFTSGGVSMGTTQYIDAYQRANFWGTVQNHTGYHLLLGGPTVLPEQTLNAPFRRGTTATVFGINAGLVDINWFDGQVQTLIQSLGIQPNTLPIFLTYNVYLTEGGQCCIGGYHSVTGFISAPQAYAQASYVDRQGSFAEDVSALSHEVGEWADDPLVVNINGNNTPCGILENGDPLEGNANFGAFPFQGTNGFTYNLQDLVTLPYFGAPPSTSVNGEFSFHGEGLTVCEFGS
ncbi:MAG: hypothetical protein J2P13_13225, partial [Acidobacteria bacterium]|nr:hypothetical protein [Acidobacteriota bacterium]